MVIRPQANRESEATRLDPKFTSSVGVAFQQGSSVVTLPAPALQLLVRILSEMAEGNAVTLVPHHTELTSQQAADLLDVSRPHLVKLLENGEIPFHKVGSHRRVRFTDVLAYKRRIDGARLEAFRKLSELSQDLGLEE